VNFGAHLANHAVNRWTRQYVRYSEMKDKIQRVAQKLSGEASSAGSQPASPNDRSPGVRSESSAQHGVSALFAPLIREGTSVISSDPLFLLTDGAIVPGKRPRLTFTRLLLLCWCFLCPQT
jgi:hypothetical protein